MEVEEVLRKRMRRVSCLLPARFLHTFCRLPAHFLLPLPDGTLLWGWGARADFSRANLGVKISACLPAWAWNSAPRTTTAPWVNGDATGHWDLRSQPRADTMHAARSMP